MGEGKDAPAQDCCQRFWMVVAVCTELARIYLGSFLVIYMSIWCYPILTYTTSDGYTYYSSATSYTELCDQDTQASFFANASGLEFLAYFLNCFTFALWCCFYILEIYRENKLISYLDVNPNKSMDSDSCTTHFQNIEAGKLAELNGLNYKYKCFCWFMFMCTLTNIIISGTFLLKWAYPKNAENGSADSAYIAYISSAMLTLGKVNKVFANARAPANVFYSGFSVQKRQYNDVDPDHAVNKADV
jgi:hypothetical protein